VTSYPHGGTTRRVTAHLITAGARGPELRGERVLFGQDPATLLRERNGLAPQAPLTVVDVITEVVPRPGGHRLHIDRVVFAEPAHRYAWAELAGSADLLPGPAELITEEEMEDDGSGRPRLRRFASYGIVTDPDGTSADRPTATREGIPVMYPNRDGEVTLHTDGSQHAADGRF